MDLFQEINETVYNERWIKRWRRYKFWFLSSLVAILLFSGGWSFLNNYYAASKRRSALTFWHGVQQLADNQVTVAQDDFRNLVNDGHPGYATLAQFNRASIALANRQFAKASDLYQTIVESTTEKNFAVFARLMSVYASLNQKSWLNESQLAFLLETANSNSAFKTFAQEIIAFSFLLGSDLNGAISQYQQILADPKLSEENRSKITLLVQALQASNQNKVPAD